MPSVQDCWIMTYNHLHFTDEKTVSQRWTFLHQVTLVNEDQTYQIHHMDPCHQMAKAMAISSSLGTVWVLNKCLWNAWVSRWLSVILLTVTSTSIPAFPFPSILPDNKCYSIHVCWEDWQVMSFLVWSSRRISCWGPNDIPIAQRCPCPADHDWQRVEPWRWACVELPQRRQAGKLPNQSLWFPRHRGTFHLDADGAMWLEEGMTRTKGLSQKLSGFRVEILIQ